MLRRFMMASAAFLAAACLVLGGCKGEEKGTEVPDPPPAEVPDGG